MNKNSDELLLTNELASLAGGLMGKEIDISSVLPRHDYKKYNIRPESKIDMIVVHCTDRDWTPEQVAEYDTKGSLTYIRKVDSQLVTDINHIDAKGIPAITYHDCISSSNVFHTLPYTESSYHASGYNSNSVAVGMLYRTTNPSTNKGEYHPPKGMFELTQCHVGNLCLKFGLSPDRVFGHRELKGTGWDFLRGRKRLLKTCPGLFVDLDLLRKNVATYMQINLKLKGFYLGEIDSLFGNKSKEALANFINV